MRRLSTVSFIMALVLAVLVGIRPAAIRAQATPDVAANEALAHRYYDELLATGDPASFDALLTPDFVIHLEAQELDGPAAFRDFVVGLRTGFPDLTYTVDDIFGEGDKVATRATAVGTQTGVFNGIPPTGRPVAVHDLILFRIAGDRIAEVWVNGDIFGLLQQLGVIPGPAVPGTPVPWTGASPVASAVATGEQDVEANKALARRWYDEVASQGNLDVIDELFAPDHVNHQAGAAPGEGSGPAGQKQLVTAFRGAFPDLSVSVEDTVGQGDRVLVRYVFTGTQTGAYNGIPPTGKRVEVTGMAIWRFANGKAAETWVIFDIFGLLQQLGVIPGPAATPVATPAATPSS
ncbi:MAG: ester cyclase [Thermomicrobiales bacterium]